MTAFAAFDEGVAAVVEGWRSPLLTGLMRLWTVSGGTLVVGALTLAALIVLWRCGRHGLAVWQLAVVGGGAAVSTLLKLLVERVRPDAAGALIALPSTHSFPSGHALASACVALAAVGLAVRLGARPGLTCLTAVSGGVYAAGVAFSRVYLGVHWASDVLGGWLVAVAWFAIVTFALRRRLRSPEAE